MDTPTPNASALLECLRRAAVLSDEEVTAMLAAVRAEALVEVRERLKDVMIASILEQAVEHVTPTLQRDRSETAPSLVPGPPDAPSGTLEPTVCRPEPQAGDIPEPQDAAQASSTTCVGSAVEANPQVLAEIEAIKAQLHANEQELSRMSSGEQPPPQLLAETGAGAVTAHVPSIDTAVYVYGVVRRSTLDAAPLDRGVDARYALALIENGEVAAVVSHVGLDEFDQERLNAHLDDIHWLENCSATHERVLGSVMAHGPVVPLALCTIFANEERVREMLAHSADGLLGALERLDGKNEWGVKLFAAGDALCGLIEQGSERLKELDAQIVRLPEGAAYFLRKKREDALAAEAESYRDTCATEWHERLSACAHESLERKLQSREVTGRTEEMILNGAYLVAEGQLAAFRLAGDELAAKYTPFGITCEITGPWPAYGFARVAPQEDLTRA